jgi:hypothetical protein
MKIPTRIVLAGIVWGASGPALAAPPESLHLDLLTGTRLPIDVQGRLQLEMPHRLRLGLHAGWMPSDYLTLINDIATGAGWYSDATAVLISAALDDAILLGADFGWRPLEKHGFFFGAGYQAALLGGSVTGTELLEEFTGAEIPQSGRDPRIGVSALVHMVDVHVGWEEVVAQNVVMRFTL